MAQEGEKDQTKEMPRTPEKILADIQAIRVAREALRSRTETQLDQLENYGTLKRTFNPKGFEKLMTDLHALRQEDKKLFDRLHDLQLKLNTSL